MLVSPPPPKCYDYNNMQLHRAVVYKYALLDIGYAIVNSAASWNIYSVADPEGVPRVPWNPPFKENQKMHLTQTVHSRQKSKLHVKCKSNLPTLTVRGLKA